MRRFVPCMILFLLSLAGQAAVTSAESIRHVTIEAPPKAPTTVLVGVGSLVSVEIENLPGKETAWVCAFADEQCVVLEGKAQRANTCLLYFFPKKAAVFRVILWTVGEGRDGSTTLVVDATTGPTPPDPGPIPKPPTPPDPPPDPKPQPTPAPIPVSGFRVLMVYDDANTAKLTQGQYAAVFGQVMRDYLNAKCATNPNPGRSKEWRIWPKGVTTDNESSVWQNAFRLPRTTLPWLVVSNGTTGFSGPLPQSLVEIQDILKKHEVPDGK